MARASILGIGTRCPRSDHTPAAEATASMNPAATTRARSDRHHESAIRPSCQLRGLTMDDPTTWREDENPAELRQTRAA